MKGFTPSFCGEVTPCGGCRRLPTREKLGWETDVPTGRCQTHTRSQ